MKKLSKVHEQEMNEGPNNSKREENEKLSNGSWNNSNNTMSIAGHIHRRDVNIGNTFTCFIIKYFYYHKTQKEVIEIELLKTNKMEWGVRSIE